MKYIIPIDKKSIKRNPKYGEKVEYIPTGREITFESNFIPTALKDRLIISEKGTCFSGILIEEPTHEEIQEILKENKDGQFFYCSVKLNYQPVYKNEPKYFYNYEIVKVKCDSCGGEFMSDEFKELECEDGYDYSYTYTGCPKCGAWHCCDVEYEDIKDIKL
jgi:hypothetical protein